MANEIRDGSIVVDLLQQAKHRLLSTTERSTAVVQTVVAGSFIYQWLTAEPDPEVIVIDLRETWTVGPIIDSIDRLPQAVRTSTLVGVSRSGARTSILIRSSRRVVTGFRDRPINAGSLGVSICALGMLLVGGLTQALSAVSAVILAVVALLAMFGLGSNTTLTELLETKAAQLLISAFEPPEPPSSTHSETDSSRQETSETETDPSVTDDQ